MNIILKEFKYEESEMIQEFWILESFRQRRIPKSRKSLIKERNSQVQTWKRLIV